MVKVYEKLNKIKVSNMGYYDAAHRWQPKVDSLAKLYLHEHPIRTPSRAYPYSYLFAVYTRKFYKWVERNHSDRLNEIE